MGRDNRAVSREGGANRMSIEGEGQTGCWWREGQTGCEWREGANGRLVERRGKTGC